MPSLPSLQILRMILFFIATLVCLGAVLPAADAEPGPDPAVQSRPSGFELGMPKSFIGGHAGINLPNASGDLFGMVQRELTLKKSDFYSSSFGFDYGVFFKERYALVFSVDYAKASPDSESRNFVEQDGQPILQSTEFWQVPATATLRYYPRKLGEMVGSYAWIPNRVLPYLLGGGGLVRYSFNQQGDFVDSETLRIFSANLDTKGFAPTIHAGAGVQFGITPRIIANVESRYSWGGKQPSNDFIGFERFDLWGLRLSGGIFYRF